MRRIIRKIKYYFLKQFANQKIESSPKSTIELSKKSFYDLKFNSIHGVEIDFNSFKGKKVLIVNVASECGFTPQYKELQLLHQHHSDKINILGFPANNFGTQEPGNNIEIETFCSKNFGVTFQLFEKSDVIGDNQNSVYQWLTNKNQNGWNEENPKWNFCKYLITENGELIKSFSAAVNPLGEEITKLL